MITIVIPTYNRGYTLKKVLPTFYSQKHLAQLVIIDDCSNDDTASVVKDFSENYPNIETSYYRNEHRSGAAASRLRGVKKATSEYILFGDDDDFLEDNYTEVCLKKMQQHNATIVSGRHFYRNPKEDLKDAITRFSQGKCERPLFNYNRFTINLEKKMKEDQELPFTHGIYLIKRSKIDITKWDTLYSKGNGYREESDYQALLYTQGEKIIMTPDTHSIHMHKSEVVKGGQRVNRLSYFYWSIYYTNYFFKKYYDDVKERLGLKRSRRMAFFIYFILEVDYIFLRPFRILARKVF